MQNIAPLGYERYAVLTNLFQKYGFESVTVKPPKRETEPVNAVNTDVARQRGTPAREMTDGNVVARSKIEKAAAGRYPEGRLNGPNPANRIWLGETSNGVRDMTESRPVLSPKKVTALYERADTITVEKAKT